MPSKRKDSTLEEDEEEDRRNEEDNGPEDLDKTLIRTQTEFRLGNESASKYEFSPKNILDDYADFN